MVTRPSLVCADRGHGEPHPHHADDKSRHHERVTEGKANLVDNRGQLAHRPEDPDDDRQLEVDFYQA